MFSCFSNFEFLLIVGNFAKLIQQGVADSLQYSDKVTGILLIILACLMIDIDNFKLVNDTYGHLIGDRILRQMANLLRREQRAVDVVARYGGEEFVILLPETGVTGARIFAERILRRVSGYEFGEPGHPVHMTTSIGVATYPDERIDDCDAMLRLADENLYRAKHDGRNRFRD